MSLKEANRIGNDSGFKNRVRILVLQSAASFNHPNDTPIVTTPEKRITEHNWFVCIRDGIGGKLESAALVIAAELDATVIAGGIVQGTSEESIVDGDIQTAFLNRRAEIVSVLRKNDGSNIQPNEQTSF